MYEALFVTPWPWWIAGPAIGLVVTLLAWLLGKPLGVSTGYGVACALGSRLSFFRAKEYGEHWRLASVGRSHRRRARRAALAHAGVRPARQADPRLGRRKGCAALRRWPARPGRRSLGGWLPERPYDRRHRPGRGLQHRRHTRIHDRRLQRALSGAGRLTMRLGLFTIFGTLFGFVLSRGRVSDYDTIAGMFRLTDLHLFGVIGTAISTAGIGLCLIRRGCYRSC